MFHPLCVRSHDDALTLTYQLGERFTYFGLSGPIQNYIKCATLTSKHTNTISNCFLYLSQYSNPYDPGSDLPGALGKGQSVASALGNFFKFWAYASTVIGAVVAGTFQKLSN